MSFLTVGPTPQTLKNMDDGHLSFFFPPEILYSKL